MLGFTNAGVAGSSIAAGVHAGIGNAVAGSTFAWMQSIGATTILGTPIGLGVGAIGVAYYSYGCYDLPMSNIQQIQEIIEKYNPLTTTEDSPSTTEESITVTKESPSTFQEFPFLSMFDIQQLVEVIKKYTPLTTTEESPFTTDEQSSTATTESPSFFKEFPSPNI